MLPVVTLTRPTSSTSHIVHDRLDVKGWLARPPTVEAARPGSCPRCTAAGRPAGGALGLHGHGVRERQLCGPPDADEPPRVTVLVLRRYRCVACGAVITVVPRGVARRRHYGHAAIAMALALWALVGETAAAVRARVCAFRITICGHDWPTLRRWARASGDPERAAQVAIGHAPPTLRSAPLWAQAFAGGSAMR